MLRLEHLAVSYGPITAVRDVSLEVAAGEVVALVGPNGAGKTSLVNAVAGAVGIAGGAVHLDGQNVTGWPSERMARRGLVLVPEGRGILATLSVAENLRLGATARGRAADVAHDLAAMGARFPVLHERARAPAGRLSGGEQQQLAIARALMSRPRLLLLDEPSLGLAPLMIERVYRILRELRAAGTTILLVEENARRALVAADRVYVMRGGVITLEGAASDLRDSPALERAYFGFEQRAPA